MGHTSGERVSDPGDIDASFHAEEDLAMPIDIDARPPGGGSTLRELDEHYQELGTETYVGETGKIGTIEHHRSLLPSTISKERRAAFIASMNALVSDLEASRPAYEARMREIYEESQRAKSDSSVD